MSVAEGAAILARVAAQAKASGPLVKAGFDPAMLQNAAIGAGVGGVGMGLLGMARGRKRNAAIRDALGGAVLGAGVGGIAGGGIGDFVKTIGKPIPGPGEEKARRDAMYPLTRAVMTANPAELLNGTGSMRMVGDALSTAGGNGIAGMPGRAIGATARMAPVNTLATAGTVGTGLHEWNRSRLAKQMLPIAQTEQGLLNLAKSQNLPADELIKQRRALRYLRDGYKPTSWQSSLFGGRADRFKSVADIKFLTDARNAGEAAIRDKPDLLANSRWGKLLAPRTFRARGKKMLLPLALRFLLGG